MKKMLIDATGEGEIRLAIVENSKLENYELEPKPSSYTKGNVYLAKVIRVEPALQAAFVEYAENVQGFLPFSEIHPDYFNIPVDDYEALMADQRAERQAAAERVEAADQAEVASLTKTDGGDQPAEKTAEGEEGISSDTEAAEGEALETPAPSIDDGVDFETQRGVVFTPKIIKRYKIQEVIKRGQLMLVQVTKEERGNKRAALSSYIALAGCYCVLIPNALFNGGVSRKIESNKERKRLKKMMTTLEVPEGMALILRTAVEGKTKASVNRDLKYLLNLWEEVRSRTLDSTAPLLIYEEADLINRSLRDIFSKQIEEVHISGSDAFAQAKKFTKQINPKLSKSIIEHESAESKSLFEKFGLEAELLKLIDTNISLRSGGELVLEQTEALVSIDINSSKAIGERNIEETALKINLEAAEEIARQLRLRDLAGLVVIDFIDMERRANQQKVERALKVALKADKARIHVGKISSFGLLEMSRQRLGPSILEKTTVVCPHCHGRGRVLNAQTVTLSLMRALRVRLAEGNVRDNILKVVALPQVVEAILNDHLQEIASLEQTYGVKLKFESCADIKNAMGWEIDPSERGSRHRRRDRSGERSERSSRRDRSRNRKEEVAAKEPSSESVEESEDQGDQASEGEAKPEQRRRKRRSGRSLRGSRKGAAASETATEETDESATEEAAPEVTAVEQEVPTEDAEPPKPKRTRRVRSKKAAEDQQTEAKPEVVDAKAEPAPTPTVSTEKAELPKADDQVAVEAPASQKAKPNLEGVENIKPKRKGWWNNLIG